jgi:hypothetical protein
MNRPVNAISGGGLVPHAVGGNQKWCGSPASLIGGRDVIFHDSHRFGSISTMLVPIQMEHPGDF